MQLLFPLEESSLHPSLRGRLRCNAAFGGRVEVFFLFKEIDHFYADQRVCEAWKQQPCGVSSRKASISEPFSASNRQVGSSRFVPRQREPAFIDPTWVYFWLDAVFGGAVQRSGATLAERRAVSCCVRHLRIS